MSVVTTSAFEKARLRALFGRLTANVAAAEANIERDPWPALQAASAEIQRLRDALDDTYAALQPGVRPPSSTAGARDLAPISIQAELCERYTAAMRVLNDEMQQRR